MTINGGISLKENNESGSKSSFLYALNRRRRSYQRMGFSWKLSILVKRPRKAEGSVTIEKSNRGRESFGVNKVMINLHLSERPNHWRQKGEIKSCVPKVLKRTRFCESGLFRYYVQLPGSVLLTGRCLGSNWNNEFN